MESDGHCIRRVWLYRVECPTPDSVYVEGCIRSKNQGQDQIIAFAACYTAGGSLQSNISGIIKPGTVTKFTLFGPPPMPPHDF